MIKHIQAGTLSLSLSHGQERLDELLAFASRENQKRGFLFVSKVLGKHIPVKPSVMRGIYDELARLCASTTNTYVIGMAETATGLGAGLADSMASMSPELDVFYQHTTRHALNSHRQWFCINESHSHAVGHIMYQPNDEVAQGIAACEQLILVDDEVTTGKTLFQLADGVIERVPAIKKLTIVTLVSWLNDEAAQLFEQLPVEVEFVYLVKGQCEFSPDPEFRGTLPETVDTGICNEPSRDDLGRTGLKMPYSLDNFDISHNYDMHDDVSEPIVVVGTGEHLYYPFLIAEQLEKSQDVLFQSTTRSPIIKGDAIQRKTFFSAGNGKVHYIYNLPHNRQRLVLCESDALAKNNGLMAGQSEDAA